MLLVDIITETLEEKNAEISFKEIIIENIEDETEIFNEIIVEEEDLKFPEIKNTEKIKKFCSSFILIGGYKEEKKEKEGIKEIMKIYKMTLEFFQKKKK